MKQHIVDTMLTIGKPGKIEAPIGMMYIAKNRNGLANRRIPLFIDGSKQMVSVISNDEYDRIKRDAINEQ